MLSQLPPPTVARSNYTARRGRREVVPWVMFEYMANAPDPAVRGQVVTPLDMELQLRGASEEGCATVLMYEDGTTHHLNAAIDLMGGTMVPAAAAATPE